MLKWCFLFSVFVNLGCSSFLDWLGLQVHPPQRAKVNILPLLKVPFEELDPEEKFLVEASKITGLKLDELDVCQQKLVLKLKTSCGELSDEELSKLAVGLLNCQSEVEGRKVFPCTPEMSLRECTREMDSETWNSYHVISNRARAVCYAARQEQFRALAEMTVNKLMTASQDHINKMTLVEENQLKLSQSTESILKQLLQSQTQVLASFSNLKKLESSLISSIAFGLNKLEVQKEHLSNVQDIITLTMKKFNDGIDNSSKQLSEQMFWNQEQHRYLKNSLAQINQTATEIFQKLKESRVVLNDREVEILIRTEKTINGLRIVNTSVSNMADWVKYFEEIGRPKFLQFKNFVGEKGEKVDLLMLLSVHMCSLLLAMLMCSFLNAPFTSRWLLCLASAVNIYLATNIEYKEFSSSLFYFYITFFLTVVGDYTSRFLYCWYQDTSKSQSNKSKGHSQEIPNNKRSENTPPQNRLPKYDTTLTHVGDHNWKVNDWLSGKYTESKNGNLFLTSQATINKDKDDIDGLNHSIYDSTRRQTSNLPPASVGGSSSVRSRCSAICRSGIPCKNYAYESTSKCRIHGRGTSELR
ncbi:protein brambleberry-like isoform X2 [Rhodnius prolixus]|uniref:protein brambleberry-like isoform X2 n=1 Tax=Rhodnius prolixus TaxID=13249 RepID=UPI003D18C386